MEDITSGLSELEIDQEDKKLRQYFRDLFNLFDPKYQKEKSNIEEEDEDTVDTRNEIKQRDKYEAKVSEAELETVQLRYIPDYIRELRTKEDYWKKEHNYWGDVISKKNWEMYKKKVEYEKVRNKTVLLNLDKSFARMMGRKKSEAHFSESLDPERVQRLVDYLKEKESDDVRFYFWKKKAFVTMKLLKTHYQDYAVFSRYGDFRARPSRLNLSKLAEEESKNLPQS